MAVTHVPLSLTENYCESWGVWEGVRELVQNVHDGAIEAGGDRWSADAEASYSCRAGDDVVAYISYDSARERLTLVNRSVGLQRRVLLLGASRKADSVHVIGQFGEGMKVGALALLREGRSFEMLTGGEHWRWTRRMDEAFGVRVLTVEVSERASAAALLVDDDDALVAKPPLAHAHDDTIMLVEPLGAGEWATFSARFLFLRPAADSFRSVELGELLLDDGLRGMLYVKGVWIADMRAEYNLGSGLNLTHLRLDRDRRAVVHASDLESQSAALWVRAIGTRPRLAARVLELMQQPMPGADVRRVSEFLGGKAGVADAIASAWFAQHGGDAVPIAQGDLALLCGPSGLGDLAALEKRLGRRLVLVSQQVLDVLGHSSGMPSVKQLEADLLASTHLKKRHPTAVAWASLDEEERGVARRVARLLVASGAPDWEVARLAVLDYGEGEFGDEEVAGETPATPAAPAAGAAAATEPSEAKAAPPTVLPAVRVPLACFSVDAVHARLGRCLRHTDGGAGGGASGGGCACRETLLLQRVCRRLQRIEDAASPPPRAATAPAASSDLSQLLGGFAPAPAAAAAGAAAPVEPAAPRATLLDAALQALLGASAADAEDASGAAPADVISWTPSVASECARRELLLRAALGEVEAAAEAERSASLVELRAVHAEVQRLQRETMQREVDACNEAGRARALAQADQQVSAERKRLEERVAALTRERDEQAARLRDTTLQLEHARERTAGKAERAEAEREAHARQEAHMDAALAQCRRRLVARTEQLYSVSLPTPSSSSGGGGTIGGSASPREAPGVAASLAATLRAERDGGLCCVCVGAPKTSVLLPCRHELCAACAAVVREHAGRCPLCRTGVAAVSDLSARTCEVCFEEHPALSGIECHGDGDVAARGDAADGAAPPPRHFLCDECLAGHVMSAVEGGAIESFARRGGVCCVHPGCAAPPFADTALARSLPEEVFGRYTRAKEVVAEQRINEQLERGFEERLATLYQRAGGVAPREAIKQHICERVLTLACPRCKQAFVDFDGCWALYCGRAGCGCGFCGICLAECQGAETAKAAHDPTHRHVNACPLLERMGLQHRVHSDEDWALVSRQATIGRLREYLDTLPEAPRQHALTDCERELRDLGIDPLRELGMVEAPDVA